MEDVYSAIYSSPFKNIVKQVTVSEDEGYTHIKAKEWAILARVINRINRIKNHKGRRLKNPRKRFEAICQYVQEKYIENKKTSINRIEKNCSFSNSSIERFIRRWNQSKRWTTFFRIMKNEKRELDEILREYQDTTSTILLALTPPYSQQQKTLVQRNLIPTIQELLNPEKIFKDQLF